MDKKTEFVMEFGPVITIVLMLIAAVVKESHPLLAEMLFDGGVLVLVGSLFVYPVISSVVQYLKYLKKRYVKKRYVKKRKES